MDSFWRIFISAVYAAEAIISPLPSTETSQFIHSTPKSTKSIQQTSGFGSLLGSSKVSPTPIPSPTPYTINPKPTSLPPTQLPTPTPTILPDPTPPKKSLKKNQYTIALIGDSMIDTLGPEAPHLSGRLKELTSGASFKILNFGAGGTNAEDGPHRITADYTYLGNPVKSMKSQSPDIVVIESFSYNPFPDPLDDGVTRHWLALAKLVDTVRASIPNAKIIIAVTIAPNNQVFGDGAAGLSFSLHDKAQRVAVIQKYLDSTIKFATGEHIPLADAYTPSRLPNGNGRLEYINPGDHIHYSDAGRAFFANIVAQTIIREGVLE